MGGQFWRDKLRQALVGGRGRETQQAVGQGALRVGVWGVRGVLGVRAVCVVCLRGGAGVRDVGGGGGRVGPRQRERGARCAQARARGQLRVQQRRRRRAVGIIALAPSSSSAPSLSFSASPSSPTTAAAAAEEESRGGEPSVCKQELGELRRREGLGHGVQLLLQAAGYLLGVEAGVCGR